VTKRAILAERNEVVVYMKLDDLSLHQMSRRAPFQLREEADASGSVPERYTRRRKTTAATLRNCRRKGFRNDCTVYCDLRRLLIISSAVLTTGQHSTDWLKYFVWRAYHQIWPTLRCWDCTL